MISKELLSEVLGCSVESTPILVGKSYIQFHNGYVYKDINIYELAHKCKEQMISNQVCVTSGNGLLKDNGFFCHIDGFVPTNDEIFYADSEPEAIFQATQYVMDNKND